MFWCGAVSGRASARGGGEGVARRGGGKHSETYWPLVSRDLAREKKEPPALGARRHATPSQAHNHYVHCCCAWAAADQVPKNTLVRALVEFVKFMHDTQQSSQGVSFRDTLRSSPRPVWGLMGTVWASFESTTIVGSRIQWNPELVAGRYAIIPKTCAKSLCISSTHIFIFRFDAGAKVMEDLASSGHDLVLQWA